MKNHWSGYVNAIGKMTPTSTNTIPFETSSSKIGVSGFLDLKPTNNKFQARYDAMSGSWEGVSASEKATLNSKSDKTEFMSWTHK
jgi:hypothetical protein